MRVLCKKISTLSAAGFDSAQLALTSDAELQEAAARVLVALPRDEALLRRHRSARSARALLSAVLLVSYPAELLADDGEDAEASLDAPEVREVRCAARLLIVTVVALTAACEAAATVAPGTTVALRTQLGVVAFARHFFAEAFGRWRVSDAERVAARLLQPYARAYATLQAANAEGDLSVAAAVSKQLTQYRLSLERVMGKSRADSSLQEVETAVEADFSSGGEQVMMMQENIRRMSSFDAPGPDAHPATAAGDASAPAATATAAEATPPSGPAAQLLANARLAHELLLNPDFQLGTPAMTGAGAASAGQLNNGNGGSDSATAAAGEVEARLRDVMHRVFWERVSLALLPPRDISRASDVEAGMRVQARYGSAAGAFYGATVVAVHVPGGGAGGSDSNGGDEEAFGEVLLDLRYEEDGVVEKNVPFSRLRKSSDPPDLAPLSSVLVELRDKLVALAPPDRANWVRAVLDPEAEALRKGPLSAAGVATVVRAAVAVVLELQAPARTESTRLWLKDFEAAAAAASEAEKSIDDGGAAAVALLPGAFEFVFARCDEIKRDTANAHLRMLAPYLARHGVDYERDNFQRLLQAGQVSLDNTRAWLVAAVTSDLSRRREEAPDVSAGEKAAEAAAAALAAGGEEAHRALLGEAFVALLQRPMRLDSSAARLSLPETLSMDAGRLAAARDAYDRIALTATMTVLFRQALARMRVPCPPAALQSLRVRLGILLQAGGVSLPDLVAATVAAAAGVCGGPLPADEAASLSSLLAHSADPTNEVFKLFFGRVGTVIAHGGLLNGGVASMSAKSGLSGFEHELATVSEGLRRVFRHNVAVFAKIYSEIVKEAASAVAAPGGAQK